MICSKPKISNSSTLSNRRSVSKGTAYRFHTAAPVRGLCLMAYPVLICCLLLSSLCFAGKKAGSESGRYQRYHTAVEQSGVSAHLHPLFTPRATNRSGDIEWLGRLLDTRHLSSSTDNTSEESSRRLFTEMINRAKQSIDEMKNNSGVFADSQISQAERQINQLVAEQERLAASTSDNKPLFFDPDSSQADQHRQTNIPSARRFTDLRLDALAYRVKTGNSLQPLSEILQLVGVAHDHLEEQLTAIATRISPYLKHNDDRSFFYELDPKTMVIDEKRVTGDKFMSQTDSVVNNLIPETRKLLARLVAAHEQLPSLADWLPSKQYLAKTSERLDAILAPLEQVRSQGKQILSANQNQRLGSFDEADSMKQLRQVVADTTLSSWSDRISNRKPENRFDYSSPQWLQNKPPLNLIISRLAKRVKGETSILVSKLTEILPTDPKADEKRQAVFDQWIAWIGEEAYAIAETRNLITELYKHLLDEEKSQRVDEKKRDLERHLRDLEDIKSWLIVLSQTTEGARLSDKVNKIVKATPAFDEIADSIGKLVASGSSRKSFLAAIDPLKKMPTTLIEASDLRTPFGNVLAGAENTFRRVNAKVSVFDRIFELETPSIDPTTDTDPDKNLANYSSDVENAYEKLLLTHPEAEHKSGQQQLVIQISAIRELISLNNDTYLEMATTIRDLETTRYDDLNADDRIVYNDRLREMVGSVDSSQHTRSIHPVVRAQDDSVLGRWRTVRVNMTHYYIQRVSGGFSDLTQAVKEATTQKELEEIHHTTVSLKAELQRFRDFTTIEGWDFDSKEAIPSPYPKFETDVNQLEDGYATLVSKIIKAHARIAEADQQSKTRSAIITNWGGELTWDTAAARRRTRAEFPTEMGEHMTQAIHRGSSALTRQTEEESWMPAIVRFFDLIAPQLAVTLTEVSEKVYADPTVTRSGKDQSLITLEAMYRKRVDQVESAVKLYNSFNGSFDDTGGEFAISKYVSLLLEKNRDDAWRRRISDLFIGTSTDIDTLHEANSGERTDVGPSRDEVMLRQSVVKLQEQLSRKLGPEALLLTLIGIRLQDLTGLDGYWAEVLLQALAHKAELTVDAKTFCRPSDYIGGNSGFSGRHVNSDGEVYLGVVPRNNEGFKRTAPLAFSERLTKLLKQTSE